VVEIAETTGFLVFYLGIAIAIDKGMDTTKKNNVMKRTHDGQIVYAATDKLPRGAIGWTQCHVDNGAYSSWFSHEERSKAKADLEKIARVIESIKTKARARRICDRLGINPQHKLSDTRTAIIITLLSDDDRWPLRESK